LINRRWSQIVRQSLPRTTNGRMCAHSVVSEIVCSNQNSFRGPHSHQIERRRLRRRQVGCRGPRRDQGGKVAIRPPRWQRRVRWRRRLCHRCPSLPHPAPLVEGAVLAAPPRGGYFQMTTSELSRPGPRPPAPAGRWRASEAPSAAPPPPRPVAVAAPLTLPASRPAPVEASAGASPRLLRAGVRVAAAAVRAPANAGR